MRYCDCLYYSDGGGCGQCWLNYLESSNINFKDEYSVGN